MPPLKSLAPFPVGACVQARQLDDPAFVALLTRHFSQVTPEWEMKMEYIVLPDGSFRFDRPDRIAAFAKDQGMRLYGTTLIWYAEKPAAFEAIDTASVFRRAFDNYLTAVVGRYRGQAAGWDCVNEPVAEDGHGWRDSLWSRRLGDFDHMRRAFDVAHAADPDVPLFINEYNLESIPAKLDTYLALIERLLKAGAPLGGIGCQTHMAAVQAPGGLTRAVRALARFGLPIHISELDVSLKADAPLLASRADLEAKQARLYGEAMDAFLELPIAQRFAFSVWGLRDSDSWRNGEGTGGGDAPLLFDRAGRAKSTFRPVADRLTRG